MKHFAPPSGGFAGVNSLLIVCDDCGRTKRWTRSQIAEVQRLGVRTIEQLGSRLTCSLCTERGGPGKNVNIRPL